MHIEFALRAKEILNGIIRRFMKLDRRYAAARAVRCDLPIDPREKLAAFGTLAVAAGMGCARREHIDDAVRDRFRRFERCSSRRDIYGRSYATVGARAKSKCRCIYVTEIAGLLRSIIGKVLLFPLD